MPHKKLKPFEFQLKEDVFSSALYVIVNKSFDTMVKDIKNKFSDFELSPSAYEGAQGITFRYYDSQSNKSYPFIYIPKFEWSIYYQGVLAHELSHFTFYTLDEKGISVTSKEPNEPYCYLFEYYFVNALRKLGKKYA